MAEKLRVVFVAGSGHTGSTLLAMLVDTHPQIVSVGETSIKPKIRRRGDGDKQPCSCGRLIKDCSFWQGVFENVRRQGFDFSEHNWANDYRLEHPRLNRLLGHHSSRRPVRLFQEWAAHNLPVFKERTTRVGRVNVAFVRALLEVSGARVFFDTTKHTLRLSRLLELPELDVKVVTLVRDVRGYAASAKRRGLSIVDASHTWRKDQEVIASITDSLPSERRMTLRYEDLCLDPAQALSRVYEFCEVDAVLPVSSVNSVDHHVIGNSMRFGGSIRVRLDESWRSRLEDEEQQRILQIAGRANAEFGYA
ncbi:MAG: sulfotransferase [Acidobacteria bacterium]|nr:sulfotransferase [Acidobacteriota bacterium]